MDKIEKLFQKKSPRDREQIKAIVFLIEINDLKLLAVKKLAGAKSLYRVRIGKYRLVFEKSKGLNLIREIGIRNEKTYRRLD
ncbi:MAG: hypothetical protein WDZ85_02090 [Candidatus Paceibacterota bacterium]